MSRFLQALGSGRVLLMDGAMGTELQRAGLPVGENAAAWNLLHPERVRAVHQAYRDAGAEVFLTNTFLVYAANLCEPFEAAGRLPVDLYKLWQAAYRLIGPGGYRLACLGPVAGPFREREFDQWGYFYTSGPIFQKADGVLLETCSSPRVRHAIDRIRRCTDRPVLLSLSYARHETGQLMTRSGHPPEWFARRARDWGVAALGVNCGRDIGMDEVIEIVRRSRQTTELPLFARPNAGSPGSVNGTPPPEALAARLPELLEAGISMVGGCCGTTPEHIAAFRRVIDAWNTRRRSPGPSLPVLS